MMKEEKEDLEESRKMKETAEEETGQAAEDLEIPQDLPGHQGTRGAQPEVRYLDNPKRLEYLKQMRRGPGKHR